MNVIFFDFGEETISNPCAGIMNPSLAYKADMCIVISVMTVLLLIADGIRRMTAGNFSLCPPFRGGPPPWPGQGGVPPS